MNGPYADLGAGAVKPCSGEAFEHSPNRIHNTYKLTSWNATLGVCAKAKKCHVKYS